MYAIIVTIKIKCILTETKLGISSWLVLKPFSETFYVTGKGVFALEKICCGNFVAVYHGEEISKDEAEKRERIYEEKNLGCYLYFFMHAQKEKWYVFHS